ncbi:MAG: hypothetical protein GWN71_15815, partial [Gammaproteobacteria bacterium]|nr:hypothetical protein [Gammaproteobacteria bacterium]
RASEGARSSPATAGAESGPGEPAGPEALGGLVLSGLDADAEAAIAEEVEPLAGMEPLHDLEAE